MRTLCKLGSKLDSASTELFLETLHNAGMHLADAAFAQIERCADFFHRQFFVVVEDNDQAFVAIETFGDQSHQIAFTDSSSGIFAAFVFENIDFTNIFIAVGFVPLLVE